MSETKITIIQITPVRVEEKEKHMRTIQEVQCKEYVNNMECTADVLPLKRKGNTESIKLQVTSDDDIEFIDLNECEEITSQDYKLQIPKSESRVCWEFEDDKIKDENDKSKEKTCDKDQFMGIQGCPSIKSVIPSQEHILDTLRPREADANFELKFDVRDLNVATKESRIDWLIESAGKNTNKTCEAKDFKEEITKTKKSNAAKSENCVRKHFRQIKKSLSKFLCCRRMDISE